MISVLYKGVTPMQEAAVYHVVNFVEGDNDPVLMCYAPDIGFGFCPDSFLPDVPREQFSFELPGQPTKGAFVKLTKEEQKGFWALYERTPAS